MLKLEYKDYTLEFKFEAGTSRGVLRKHQVILIKIYDHKNPGTFGTGEAAPLENLSPEKFEDLESEVHKLAHLIKSYELPNGHQGVASLVRSVVSHDFPSLKFALETALHDLLNGGRHLIFENDFDTGEKLIPINGLIWMGNRDFMKEQIDEKVRSGFRCVKMKIGAIDFEEEIKLIEYLRSQSDQLVIRVDANGAFKNNEAFNKLSRLEPFGIHSIEQPIMPRQWEAMQLICLKSPIPIALDEELIGINGKSEKQELLRFLKPAYLVLKPTLLGGFSETEEWIELAQQQNIGWWITSALESNVGLNAITQFVAGFDNPGFQGLGTGQLYTNNFNSPLVVHKDFILKEPQTRWADVF